MYKLMQDAEMLRTEFSDEYVAIDTLLLALMKQRYNPLSEYLTAHGADEKKLKKVIEEMRGGEKVTSKIKKNNTRRLKNTALTLSNRFVPANRMELSGAMKKFATRSESCRAKRRIILF